MRLLGELESNGSIPENAAISDVGELANILNVLIEGYLDGGADGLHASKKALLKTNPPFMRIAAMYAPVEAPSEQQDPRKIILPNGKTAFRTYKISDLRKMPRVKWLVSGLLQMQSISLLYGDANTGKTFTALDIALHIALGMDWIGRPIREPGHVLYIYAEGNTGLLDRADAWMKHNSLGEPDNIDFLPFPVQIIGEREELVNTIENLGITPDLIVFDTFSMCAEGVPENDNTEVARCLASAAYFKHTYKSHVMITHHVGKNGKYRGAASFRGNVDTMIQLSAEENDDTSIKLECDKQRDKQKFEPFYLKLETIDLGMDPETLESLSSCVIIAGDAVKNEQWKDKADSEQKLMLSILANNPKAGTSKWETLCKDAGIPARVFDTHRTYMLNKRMISAIAPERNGLRTTYKIAPAYIPAQEPALGEQEDE
jgi:hypothetical protein